MLCDLGVASIAHDRSAPQSANSGLAGKDGEAAATESAGLAKTLTLRQAMVPRMVPKPIESDALLSAVLLCGA